MATRLTASAGGVFTMWCYAEGADLNPYAEVLMGGVPVGLPLPQVAPGIYELGLDLQGPVAAIPEGMLLELRVTTGTAVSKSWPWLVVE